MNEREQRPTTLDGWFFRTAGRHPDATALEVDGARVPYGRLADAAERLAGVLAEKGSRPPAVGLVASRSLTAYAGYLAALRAGATVVPVSVDPLTARTVEGCAAAGVAVVVTDAAGARSGADLARAIARPVVALPGDGWVADLPAAGGDAPPGDPEAVAYTLFTSGSTGRPKGVPIRHRQLGDYLDYCVRRYGMTPGCRASQTFELTFDPSVFDMFVTWSGGGTLVVPQRDELLTPARFAADRGLTHWFSVPSVISLARRLRGLSPGSMPELRWSLFAGEPLTVEQALAWARAAPGSVVENLYGPTELTITCTGYRLPADPTRWPRTRNGTVPIGRPYPHLEARLAGTDRADGAGELWMRGPQRFDGYLDPHEDAAAFVPADGGAWYRTGDRVRWEDGELVHLGRIDDQIKINGHRVEPAEVEAALRGCPGVREAVVVGVDVGGGRVGLQGGYSGTCQPEAVLAEHLLRRLPPYMVPTRLRHLAELPTNANGKVDRGRLRELWSVPG
jgi:amino acid adenylation domain-containing protein